jgi:hypothetical protein
MDSAVATLVPVSDGAGVVAPVEVGFGRDWVAVPDASPAAPFAPSSAHWADVLHPCGVDSVVAVVAADDSVACERSRVSLLPLTATMTPIAIAINPAIAHTTARPLVERIILAFGRRCVL